MSTLLLTYIALGSWVTTVHARWLLADAKDRQRPRRDVVRTGLLLLVNGASFVASLGAFFALDLHPTPMGLIVAAAALAIAVYVTPLSAPSSKRAA